MATTASTAAGGLTLPLTRIHVPENVRALNAEHVDALAASRGVSRPAGRLLQCWRPSRPTDGYP